MKSFSLAVVVLVGASTFPSISASSCTGSTPNWKDLYGDGCEWYESADKPGCPTHGQMYDGGMGVANDNCCYCEGTGAPTVAPPTWAPWTWAPTVPYPTHSPTVSKAPVTPLCTGSTPGWVDSSGDGCEWYESVDKPGCPHYGDSYAGDMGVANDNCCYCEGTGAPTVAPPTYSPWTWAPTVPNPTHSPTVSKAPVTPPCTGSTPGWKDWDGDGCEWYEANDTPGCEWHGEEHEGDMGVAADNCCYCMSTDAPSSDAVAPPTAKPSTRSIVSPTPPTVLSMV